MWYDFWIEFCELVLVGFFYDDVGYDVVGFGFVVCGVGEWF